MSSVKYKKMLFTNFFRKKVDKIYTEPGMEMILFRMSELHQDKFKNWSKNRPPDKIRITQLIDYYRANNIHIVPGIIYVWSYNDQFLVYDGIHRLMAAISCYDDYNIDMNIIIQFRDTDKEVDIINDFLSLNKSISVPTVYLENDNYTKKIVCQTLADALCNKYPSFVSPSKNHYRYNFNRDKMVDFFSSLDIDFNRTNIDKIILNEMNGLNHQAREYVKRNNIIFPNKCAIHDFYLFFLDMYFIRSALQSACHH